MRTDRRRDSLSLYEKLRYISKTKGNNAYINLGIDMTASKEIEVKSDYLFDYSQLIGTSTSFKFYPQKDIYWQFQINNRWISLGTNPVTLQDGIYSIIVRSGQIEDVYTGKKIGSIMNIGGDAPITVFVDSYNSYGNVYYFNIKENGKYIMKLIPVKRKSDGMIGMYDKVGGKFYTSPNGAKFSGGVSRRISLLPLFTSAMAERRAA